MGANKSLIQWRLEAEAAVVRLSAVGVPPEEATGALRACIELVAAEPGTGAFGRHTGWEQPLRLLEAVYLGVCGGILLRG